MIGKRIGIEENIIYVQLKEEILKTKNIINLHVTLNDSDGKIIGEITDIKDGIAYINLLGELINDKFVFGVIRRPSFASKVTLIDPSDVSKIISV